VEMENICFRKNKGTTSLIRLNQNNLVNLRNHRKAVCSYSVGVLEDGEFATEIAEFLQVEFDGDDGWLAERTSCNGVAISIDEHGAATVLAGGIGADAVHSYHIALVLDGTGMEQGVPYGKT